VSRKRTGLRNRNRTGKHTYFLKHKSGTGDRYGEWAQGYQLRPDVIAGRVMTYRMKAMNI
jgi:hypothetical protein